MHVIGTAGHVDHGKSTLIASLTGIHPDRLKEEQEREMTIDLGFAWLTLPDGEEVGIVDVPGHRDFIENMLAGIGGIEAVLLVIAADEGIMPQTREHLAILDLLQIQLGIVVLTKIDLVDDPSWLDLVEGDIRDLLRSTILQDAPICRVSSRTRVGFPELLRTLSLLLQNQSPRPDLGRPRLPIDRVFSIAGFGTVVTGTLTDGHLSLGDEVEILPSSLHGRIRGLETHKRKEEIAVPGSRTAVNISGMNTADLRRGDVICHPGQYRPTQRLDVHFRLLPNVSGPLRHASEVKIFLGTAEVIANVRLLVTETFQPGQVGWLQLELRHPVVAVRGDKYILRRPSPGETLGGGTVADPQPKSRHKRFDEALVNQLESLARGSPVDVLLQTCLALGLATIKDAVMRSRLELQNAVAALEELIKSGQLVPLDNGPLTVGSNGLVMAASQWSTLTDSVVATLVAFHKSYPLRRGMPREELKSRLKLSPRFFSAVTKKLAAEGALIESGSWVKQPGHEIRFDPEQQTAIKRLMDKFTADQFSPPLVKECQADAGEDIFSALLELGDLVTVSDEVVFRKTDYEAMVKKIRQVILKNGQITLAEVRDLFKTSRRYAQALLEYLDAVGITLRDGDFRKLKS